MMRMFKATGGKRNVAGVAVQWPVQASRHTFLDRPSPHRLQCSLGYYARISPQHIGHPSEFTTITEQNGQARL